MNQVRRAGSNALVSALMEQFKFATNGVANTLSSDLVEPLYLYDLERIGDILGATRQDPDIRFVYVVDVAGGSGALTAPMCSKD